MKLLITLFSPTTGTWGGMTRVVALYEAARKAGHQVAFCASGAMAEGLTKHGYSIYPTPPTTMLGLPAPISRVLEQRSQRVSLPVKPGQSVGSLWLVMFISGLGRAGYLRRLVADQRAAVHDFKPDALFTDIDPGAYLTARIEHLPIAASYSEIMHTGVGSWPWKQMNAAIAPILLENGVPVQTIDSLYFAPETLKIIPSIPELDDAGPDRPDMRYVGQMLGPVQPAQPGDFQPEPGKRYIFVYMGTGAVTLDQLRRTLPQVFPEGGDTVCLVGSQSAQVEQIGNVRFMPYVPANAVIPHCDWVFCHGGQNTIAQSLMNGVPLIIFPGPVFERRFNARKVQESGAGWMGEMDQFTPTWIEKAMQTHPSRAERARALGEIICAYGGAEQAVQAIAEMVNK